MKLQKSIRIDMKVAAFLIIFSTINFFLNPIDAYGFSSLREITYKNINTVLTAEDLDLQGESDDYTFYIAPIGSDSAERINLPLSLDENVYLGTNDLTILGPQGIVTVKVVVTEASREVDREGWTIIEASADTRIVYVSSSEGDDDQTHPDRLGNVRPAAHKASDIGVTTPDDTPQDDYETTLRVNPIMTSATEPEGEVSASYETHSHYPFWRVFNGSGSGVFGDGSSGWVQYRFESPTLVTAYSITETRERDTPKDWSFEGSDDGENWDVLDTQINETGWGSGETRVYELQNNESYQYYRLNVTDNQGGAILYIRELELLGQTTVDVMPVETVGKAESLVRDGYADWILFKRGNEWEVDGSISPGPGRSLNESFVLGAYGEANSRPLLQELRANVSHNSIVNGLNIEQPGSSAENVLFEDCNFHYNKSGYITGTSGWSNFEMRRCIISVLKDTGLENAMYFNSSTGILIEEILFNLHIDQTLSEDSHQATRTMFYIQTGVNNFRSYRNIVTNSVRTPLQNRGSGRAIYRENIFSRNPSNISANGYHHGNTQSPLHIDNNVIIEGSAFGLVTGGTISSSQDTITGNILANCRGASRAIHVRGGASYDMPLDRIRINDNIVHDFGSTSPFYVDEGGTDIEVFNNILHNPNKTGRVIEQRAPAAEQDEYRYKNNRYLSGRTDGQWFRQGGTDMDFEKWVSETGDTGSEALTEPLDFVDPDRTLATYHAHLTGEVYEDSSGVVNVVDAGDGNYSQVEWVSGKKFSTDWGRPDAAKIVIDGTTYKIYEVVDDENITLTEWDASRTSLPSYSIPESEKLGVDYSYDSAQLAHRDFIEAAKQQSRQNWDWDYHPVKIQDYFREGFEIGFASPGAPEEVADLKAETLSETDGEVLLSWTATGNNGNNIGGFYEVRFSTYTAEEKSSVKEWWDSISTDTVCYYSGIEIFENPKNAGDTEERIVDRLHPGATFYFGIRVYNAEIEKSGFDKNLSVGNPASAVAGNANPKPPSKLRFNYIGTNARLVWDKSTSSVLKNYIIHKSTVSEGSVKSTKTVCGAETEYDISLNSEENYFEEYDKYYFTVSAVNIADSTSTHSNEVKLTPDVTPPVIEDLTARTRVLGRQKIKVSVTDDRQVYEVGGGYRSLGSISGEYQELEFLPEPEEGSPSYEGRAEIDDFYISSEGFEYYITASDAFNTSTTTWIQVRSVRDLPEQGFLTPNNPELIFGSEVEEVLITDVRGNEVFSKKRDGLNYIVWNPSRDGSISLESGLYIYRIKTDGDYKYGSVVIAK